MPENELHTTEEWIEILKRQAEFTREYRHNLYQKIDIKDKKRILDIGCGTGVITADIALLTQGCITGIDIDKKKLEYARTLLPDTVDIMTADALTLPFKDNTFDLVVFHVVLVHIKEQQKAVKEMARVTQKNGTVLAVLEPDYAGELCYPENKMLLALLEHFEDMGVDTTTGRRLKCLFSRAGLKTELGICTIPLDFLNKDVTEQLADFQKNFPSAKKTLAKIGWTDEQIEDYEQETLEIIKENIGFSFTPAFYAIGRKM